MNTSVPYLAPVKNRQQYAETICRIWQRGVEGIIEAGQEVARAKKGLDHGEFLAMVKDDLPFEARAAEMLMAIARHPIISNTQHVAHLPNAWGTLYELTLVPVEVLEAKIADGTINPGMERKHAVALKPAEKPSKTKAGKAVKKKKQLPRPDQEQRQAAINVRPDYWETFKGMADKEGKTAAAALGEMVEEMIDSGGVTGQQRAESVVLAKLPEDIREELQAKYPDLLKIDYNEDKPVFKLSAKRQKEIADEEHRAEVRARKQREKEAAATANDDRPRVGEHDIVMYGVQMWPFNEDLLMQYDFDQLYFAIQQFNAWSGLLPLTDDHASRAQRLRERPIPTHMFATRRLLPGRDLNEIKAFVMIQQKLADLYLNNPTGECTRPNGLLVL